MSKKTRIYVEGMTCTGCEAILIKALKKIPDIQKVKASFSAGYIEFEAASPDFDLKHIKEAIEKEGYKIANNEKDNNEDNRFTLSQLLGIGIIVLAAFMIIKNTVGFNFIPDISSKVGYFALFVIGLVTSLHCVAMCGGINISQCMKYTKRENSLRPSVMYNAGRVISYTLIGGMVGLLGATISFNGWAKGIVAIISGIFMILMGLNLFGNFPFIRKFIPRIPGSLRAKTGAANNKSPFVIGLLNGLMPCGPLQAMQLYALGTGSFFAGASSMFFFSLGTVPLMLGLGIFSTYMGARFSRGMMKAGAVLVIALGVVMLGRGFALSGLNIAEAFPAFGAAPVTYENSAVVKDGVQVIETALTNNGYPVITVKKGIPVRWNIKADADKINGCNQTLIIPTFNIQKDLKPGDNIIEFTPAESGTIGYSCWMGMIRSNINVVDNNDRQGLSEAPTAAQNTTNAVNGLGEGKNSSVSGNGSCCSAAQDIQPTSNNDTDNLVKKAEIKNGLQTITIKVNGYGYDPQVIVMQKGMKSKIHFDVKQLTGCNSQVYFSTKDMSLDLGKGEYDTEEFIPQEDIAFSCGMGMLNGFIKVVPDLDKADVSKIQNELFER